MSNQLIQLIPNDNFNGTTLDLGRLKFVPSTEDYIIIKIILYYFLN